MGRPHLGNAFEKIGADVQARYRRMQGYDVRLLLGSDEHTVLIPRYASAANIPTAAFVQQRAAVMQSAWRALNVNPDQFVRTSSARHERGCRLLVQTLHNGGFLYRKRHEALYCENCEEFKRPSDLREGFCDSHPSVRAIVVREENYFFRLASFQERLLELYARRPDFLRPPAVQMDIVAAISHGLDDIAITRQHTEWGIRVPFDAGQTIYVWVDALASYLTAAGYGSNDASFRRWWPADLQVIGRDIAWFHGVLWPALLMASGVQLPRHIEVHGLMRHQGEKMSKTMGNVVDALELADRYGADAVRFFLMRTCPFHEDGDFSDERFADVYRRELAGQLGVLYDTAAALCLETSGSLMRDTSGERLVVFGGTGLPEIVEEMRVQLERCEYDLALATLFERVVSPVMRNFDAVRPALQGSSDTNMRARIAIELIEVLRVIAIALKPFTPETSVKIYETFGHVTAFDDLRLEDAERPAPLSPDALQRAARDLGGRTPLFPPIDMRGAAVARIAGTSLRIDPAPWRSIL